MILTQLRSGYCRRFNSYWSIINPTIPNTCPPCGESLHNVPLLNCLATPTYLNPTSCIINSHIQIEVTSEKKLKHLSSRVVPSFNNEIIELQIQLIYLWYGLTEADQIRISLFSIPFIVFETDCKTLIFFRNSPNFLPDC